MRKMALTVPAASTFVMASWRQPGNCSPTSSRTFPDETASWPSCMFTPAASRAPAHGRNRLSSHTPNRGNTGQHQRGCPGSIIMKRQAQHAKNGTELNYRQC
jgi:hypothetical protein